MTTAVAIRKIASLASYTTLRERVRQALARGRERAANAVEREKVRTSWEIGKLINEHVFLNKARADYGKKVVKRLSADFSISETELYYMMEFARATPIFRTSGKLSWGHIQSLLRINDAQKRKSIAEQVKKENWSVAQTRREITKLKATKEISTTEIPAEAPLVPVQGKLDTYRIVTAKVGPWLGRRAIDLGFSNYYVPSNPLSFPDRLIVHVSKGGRPTQAKEAAPADLFTYRAYLLEVTDGDTLWVLIDLGFGFVTQQHVRLRGVDAPEITSLGGQAAKRFVERQLRPSLRVRQSSVAGEAISNPLVITSTKSDKYDRYLVDVFYTKAGKEYFLNNELLKRGLSVGVE